MSKSEHRPPPATDYSSNSQPGYSAGNNNYYPPNQGYSQAYQQQQHQQPPQYQQYPQQHQQPYQPGYHQPGYQQQHYAPQYQQQPVYVQQQQDRGGFRPGTDAWSWCCGFLSLAMCLEMLLILIPF